MRLAVRELGYVPNAIAGSLRSRRSKTIGLIIPDVTNSFFSELALHVERSAAAAGYNVILGNSDNSAERKRLSSCARGASRRRHHLSCRRTRSTFFEIEIPLVGVDGGRGRPFVASENRAGAKSAVEYLHSTGPPSDRLRRRTEGLAERARATHGLRRHRAAHSSIGGRRPSAYIVSADFSYDSGYAATRRLMEVAPRPTAIFASSDQQAIGGLRAAADLGLAVPGDLSIVGFDDIPLANLVMPRLTTVGQPVAKIGVLAMQLLLDLGVARLTIELL